MLDDLKDVLRNAGSNGLSSVRSEGVIRRLKNQYPLDVCAEESVNERLVAEVKGKASRLANLGL